MTPPLDRALDALVDSVLTLREDARKLARECPSCGAQAIADGVPPVAASYVPASSRTPYVPLSKHTALADEHRATLEELRITKAQLAITRTSINDVWVWMDDGKDEVESLSCPVVMSAETARDIKSNLLTAKTAVEQLREGLRDALAACLLRRVTDDMIDQWLTLYADGRRSITKEPEGITATVLEDCPGHRDAVVGKPGCTNCDGSGRVKRTVAR